MLGMTREEIGLVLFIFALVYTAGLLPKIARRVASLFGYEDET